MSDTRHNDCAVALCCDRAYLPMALFVIRQIAVRCPDRAFDFVIASQDELAVPGWAQPLGIRLHRIGVLPDVKPPERFRGSMAPYFRLLLAREIGGDYRRILYLDCDVFIDGGDFNRILNVDLGPYPLAAVRDVMMVMNPSHHAVEFKALGWKAHKYANSGVLLIDTAAFLEQDLDHRAFAMYAQNAAKATFADQSLLNLALRGEFAELSPVWNWQLERKLPRLTARHPAFVQHLIGAKKPYTHADDGRNPRFLGAYREHFTAFDPTVLATLPAASSQAPRQLSKVVYAAVRHLQARPVVEAFMAEFADPYFVRTSD